MKAADPSSSHTTAEPNIITGRTILGAMALGVLLWCLLGGESDAQAQEIPKPQVPEAPAPEGQRAVPEAEASAVDPPAEPSPTGPAPADIPGPDNPRGGGDP